jgi:hypothetical protein
MPFIVLAETKHELLIALSVTCTTRSWMLDNDKDLSFALIQDPQCARQFRRHPDELHPAASSRDLPGTPQRNQGPHGATRTALNKTRPQPGDGVSVFLCNFLDDHGVRFCF